MATIEPASQPTIEPANQRLALKLDTFLAK